MINYVTPALTYVLKALGVRDKYLSAAAAFLVRCWRYGICVGAGPYLQICAGDPRCEYIKYVVKNRDKRGAMRLYTWFLKCTGRRAVKLVEVDGRTVAHDYTDYLMRRYPPVNWAC